MRPSYTPRKLKVIEGITSNTSIGKAIIMNQIVTKHMILEATKAEDFTFNINMPERVNAEYFINNFYANELLPAFCNAPDFPYKLIAEEFDADQILEALNMDDVEELLVENGDTELELSCVTYNDIREELASVCLYDICNTMSEMLDLALERVTGHRFLPFDGIKYVA